MTMRESGAQHRRGSFSLRRLALALPACAGSVLVILLIAAHAVVGPFGHGIAITPRPARRAASPAHASAWPSGTVDINLATVDELCALRGVGPKLAQAIVEERAAGGGFAYPEDLIAVNGIGAKTLSKFRDQLDFTAQEQAAKDTAGSLGQISLP